MHGVSDTFLVQHVSTASRVSKSDRRLIGHCKIAIKNIQESVLQAKEQIQTSQISVSQYQAFHSALC